MRSVVFPRALHTHHIQIRGWGSGGCGEKTDHGKKLLQYMDPSPWPVVNVQRVSECYNFMYSKGGEAGS